MAAKRDYMRNRIWECERDFDTHHHLSHDDEWMTDDELRSHLTRLIKRKAIQDVLHRTDIRGVILSNDTNCIPILRNIMSSSKTGEYMNVVEFNRSRNGTPLRQLHQLTHLMRGERNHPVLHDGGFVSNYLNVIRRFYPGDADRRKERAAEFKQMLLDANVKTSMKSEATREAARYRAHLKKLPERRDELAAMIADLKGES